MHFKWLEEITDKSPFSNNFNYQYTHKETVLNSKKIDHNRVLSTVEQLLISRYYILNKDGLSDTITRIDDFGIDRLEKYLELFNKVKYFYDDKVLRFVKISNPKPESMELFEKQVKTKQISDFVRSIYLNPHDKLSTFSNSELISETHLSNLKRIGFSLNTHFVKKVDLSDMDEDFLGFMKYCHPIDFGVEPNKVIMDENILNNYAVRLLTTIYKNVYFIVDKETRRIIYIMGKYQQ